MRLSDLLKPEDGASKDTTMSLRRLVRQKSFKTMVRALGKNNNPRDGTKDLEHLGDGGRDEPIGATRTNTVDIL